VDDFAPQRVAYDVRRTTCHLEAVKVECVDQLGDGRRAVLEQVQGQNAAQLVAA
jgi:hypothetical protein